MPQVYSVTQNTRATAQSSHYLDDKVGKQLSDCGEYWTVRLLGVYFVEPL